MGSLQLQGRRCKVFKNRRKNRTGRDTHNRTLFSCKMKDQRIILKAFFRSSIPISFYVCDFVKLFNNIQPSRPGPRRVGWSVLGKLIPSNEKSSLTAGVARKKARYIVALADTHLLAETLARSTATGGFQRRWARDASNDLLSVLTAETSGTQYCIRSGANLETCTERPHLKFGFHREPGLIWRAAHTSLRRSVPGKQVCHHCLTRI